MSDPHPLVCRFGAFGDMIMLTPLLKRLYDRCGQPADIISIGQWSKVMFQHMPYVRHVYTVNSRSAPYLLNRSQRKMVKQIKAHHYTNAWICEYKAKSYRLMKQAGIQLKHSICAKDYPVLANEHSAAFLLRLANETPYGFNFDPISVTDDSIELNSELFVSDEEVEECKQWLLSKKIDTEAPIVCIQAGNKKTAQTGILKFGTTGQTDDPKYWPEVRWAETINMLSERLPTAEIVLCGVPAEQAIALNIKSLSKNQQRIHCVADDLPLRRLLAILSIAHSCISVDTGPAHAAAALNCPLTVLFGKTDPRLCRPVSTDSNVMIVTGRDFSKEFGDGTTSWANAHSMDLISPDTVINNWIESTAT